MYDIQLDVKYHTMGRLQALSCNTGCFKFYLDFKLRTKMVLIELNQRCSARL